MDSMDNFISVGEYAKFVGKSTQQVYNLLRSGVVSGFEFTRGTMRGWLVEKPNGFDTWAQQERERKL